MNLKHLRNKTRSFLLHSLQCGVLGCVDKWNIRNCIDPILQSSIFNPLLNCSWLAFLTTMEGSSNNTQDQRKRCCQESYNNNGTYALFSHIQQWSKSRTKLWYSVLVRWLPKMIKQIWARRSPVFLRRFGCCFLMRVDFWRWEINS